ncbi:DNA polymerase Y family protein [Corynebacterium sp.]|uniref:Y-family DNA polymerase n=1 Tax=Corynebacterium sp. TaxID=1720 RepID=UPI0026DCE6FF|nr:DNA polymerase Y family protein [Corynebacterium sp.]MDO4610461.1 DNA polymerase Y family protein [Corynebacterium sp.]
MRAFALWLPDWPVQALRLSGEAIHDPRAAVAVVEGAAVAACSATARRRGVRRGMPQRHAQAVCPDLVVADADPARDAAMFEPVVESVHGVAAGVEALRPGLVAVGAGAPSRYHGGEDRALELLVDAAAVAGADCLAGAADEVPAAVLAARRGALVPEGRDRGFLATVPIAEAAAEPALGLDADLAATWAKLGLGTLGDLAALPASDVASRFGAEGTRWHRLASGDAGRGVSPRTPPRDLVVGHAPEEPLERVDAAAFAARTLAAALHARLRDGGWACTRLAVTARFGDGEEVARTWRCAGPLTERATADRVRWQLDGWLGSRAASGSARAAGPAGKRDDALGAGEPRGIVALELEPLDVHVAGTIREALWGGADEASERAGRAAARVQGLLGPDAVVTPVDVGGRGPAERIALVPAGERAPAKRGPWPGSVPPPSPAMAPAREARHPSSRAALLDGAGKPVTVSGRGTVSGEPAWLERGGRRTAVTAWAGPWPVDERWWAAGGGRRAARMQVAVAGSRGPEAHLLIGHAGRWRVEGTYR